MKGSRLANGSVIRAAGYKLRMNGLSLGQDHDVHVQAGVLDSKLEELRLVDAGSQGIAERSLYRHGVDWPASVRKGKVIALLSCSC